MSSAGTFDSGQELPTGSRGSSPKVFWHAFRIGVELSFSAIAGKSLSSSSENSFFPSGMWLSAESWGGAELYTPAALVPAPKLFSMSGDGKGQGAIWQATNGQLASSGTPAIAGAALSMYTTNLAEGGVIPPEVFIGEKSAQILYFGDAPGFPGFNQVNILVPDGIVPGSAIPVRLIYLGRSSNEVTISVQ